MTLTGPGGSGKTRLAIAAAGRLQQQWGDAVAFVPLADRDEGARLPDAVADALDLVRTPERAPLEQVVAHLRERPWLLVLDNFEHLVESGALLVRTLLERVPTLTLLVTSRLRLGLSGEQELTLLPLPTPRVGGVGCRVWGAGSDKGEPISAGPYPPHPTPHTLMSYPSIQLFVDRARAARADFALTAENAAAVAELCGRLDGLPLAIELAAARAAVLSPAEMLAHLQERFAFLVSRQRDLPSRHRTLRAAIEGSCQMLDPPLRQFFARLAVFRGGWTLEAAAAVAGEGVQAFGRSGVRAFGCSGIRCSAVGHRSDPTDPTDPTDPSDPERLDARTPERLNAERLNAALNYLEQLRDSSLILAEEAAGAVRYRILETLREYGEEQLAAAGELAAVRDRHRDWCLQLALRAAAAASGPEEKPWLARLEAEIDNLRAALAWCLEDAAADPAGEGAAAALRLLEASWWLWYARGRPTEGLHWLEGALARGRHVSPAERALALVRASHLCSARGDRDRSRSHLEQAHREYEALLVMLRREGDPAAVAEVVLCLSEVAFDLEDLHAAWEFGREARQLFETLREPGQIATAVHWLAAVALRRRDLPTARALLEERIVIGRSLGDVTLLIHALGAMGHLERDGGDYARAGALYRESLHLRRQLGHQIALAQSLEDLAGLASRQQQPERAIRLLGAVEAFCETLGARAPVAVREEYERAVAQGRAALGETAFAAAWAEGRAMSLDQALEYALAEA